MHVRRRGRGKVPSRRRPTRTTPVHSVENATHTIQQAERGEVGGPNENAARAALPAASLFSSFEKRARLVCWLPCAAEMRYYITLCRSLMTFIKLVVCCFSPFQTRRSGGRHPLDTPARIGSTKTPLSEAKPQNPESSLSSSISHHAFECPMSMRIYKGM